MRKEQLKFYGSIGSEINADSFTEQLQELEKKGCTDLDIRMHCYGGSVFEGNVIYNAIKSSKMKINIIIDGIAASMAAIIILAVNNVVIAENGFVMVHRPKTGTFDSDADSLESNVTLLRNMEQNFVNIVSNRSRLSEQDVKQKWFDGRDHWLNADEAIQYGFAKSKIESVAKDIKTLNVNSLLTENVYNKYYANFNESNYKDWNWYQANAPRELEQMPEKNPALFAKLYKAEFGVHPSSISRKVIVNSSVELDTFSPLKDWNWYQANAPRELEQMPEKNPVLFAALYKNEFKVDNKN